MADERTELNTLEQSINTCINCGEQVSSKYCPACGQPNPPKKLGFATLWFDFQSRIYGFDGMFPRTSVELTLRPGKVALAYIKGNRVKYVGPVGLFFLMLTFYVLFIEILGIDFYEMYMANNPMAVKGSARQEAFSKDVSQFIYNNLKWVSLFTLPLYALWLKLFFRKSKYNFLEHSILLFYINSYLHFYMILGLFLFAFADVNTMLAFTLLSIPYYAFACMGFYPQYSRVSASIRGMLVALLGIISIGIISMVVGFVYVIMHPELLQQAGPPSNP